MTQIAMMTPEPQRMRALKRANKVRLARADLKRRIADGHVSAARVILVPPLEAHSWAVGELLTSQKRWGSTRCRKFLQRHSISETKALGDLTDRQRQLLADGLGACAAHDFKLHASGQMSPIRERELELV